MSKMSYRLSVPYESHYDDHFSLNQECPLNVIVQTLTAKTSYGLNVPYGESHYDDHFSLHLEYPVDVIVQTLIMSYID